MTKLMTACCALVLTAILVAGCSKDKFNTRPSLKFKSISTYDVAQRGLFEIKLEYTDAEGDISVDNNSFVIRRSVPRCVADTTVDSYRLPTVPQVSNASGEIVIRFANNTVDFVDNGYAIYNKTSCNGNTGRPDTTTFRFFLTDKAGNKSDTVTTDRPVIIR